MAEFKDFAPPRRLRSNVDISPDGTRVVYISNLDGQHNLYLVPTSGGAERQLTHYTEHAVRQVAWSPTRTSSRSSCCHARLTYADAINAPLFVIQGANDPRVTRAESDQIVAALRDRGIEVRYDVYEDEGHGFTNRANEIKAIGDVAEFLLANLPR